MALEMVSVVWASAARVEMFGLTMVAKATVMKVALL